MLHGEEADYSMLRTIEARAFVHIDEYASKVRIKHVKERSLATATTVKGLKYTSRKQIEQ